MSFNPINNQQLQQASAQQEVLQAESIRKAQQKKVIQEDIIQKEQEHPFVSQFIAPTSTLWAAPQLVKSLYLGEQPATSASQDLAKLPPPPPSIQRFWQAYQQIKGTSPRSTTPENATPQDLANMGEAEFLKMSSKIQEKGNAIVNQSFNESLNQENVALVKLEEINDIANDLTSLEAELSYLLQEMENAKSNGQASSAAYNKYKAALSAVNQALENGAVTYHYRDPMKHDKLCTGHFKGDITQFLAWKGEQHIGWSNTKVHFQGTSCAEKWMNSFFNDPQGKGISKYMSILKSITLHNANAKSWFSQAKGYEGVTMQRLIIPAGHTATFEKQFPNPPFKVVTNMSGTVEIECTSTANMNKVSSFCKQNGWPIPPNARGTTMGGFGEQGQIPDKQDAVHALGVQLCQLLGWPPGKIDMNDIAAALAIARKLQQTLKKILEALNEKGDGMAVFLAMQNAVSKAQTMNQMIVAQTAEKSSATNLTMLDQLQHFMTIIADDLSQMNTLIDEIQANTTTLNSLTDAGYASSALGGLAFALMIASMLCPATWAIGAFAATSILAGLSVGATAMAGIMSTVIMSMQGSYEFKIGEETKQLADTQKAFASDQAYVQHTQAASNMIMQMTSSTTQTIQQIVQRQVDIEKDVMQMFNTASQTVTASSQA